MQGSLATAGRRAPTSASSPGRSRWTLSPLVLIFVATLVLPVFFYLGTIRLAPIRILLLVCVVPLLISWLNGGCGRIRLPDILVMLFAGWMFVTFMLDGPASSTEYAVFSAIETIAPYLLARRFVQTQAQYAALVRALTWVAAFLLPAAVIESLTGRQIYTMALTFLPTFPWADYETRLGMFRAQTVFEHPILSGVFAGSLFALVSKQAAASGSLPRSFLRTAPVVGTTFFSLSSGAYVCMAVQVMLMSWGFVLRSLASRWKLLVGLAVLAYVVIEVGSNRTAFQVMSSYLAFDPGTAYWRVLIAKYGTEEVWRHPIFGLGLNDWVRPSWMHDPTVDNFWLLQGMRHGIPGFLLAVGLYGCCILQLVRARPADPDARRNRDGLAFSLIGLGVAIITVHLWGATYNFFLFLLGATAWFGAVEQQPQATSETRRPSGSRSPAQPTRDPERGGIEGA